MVEPTIVVPHREHLWWMLLEAAELEHMIMCQYLFAEFSMKESSDESLTPEQADAVDRWRATIRGIAVEEMLHLALVSNVLAAIGGAPTFNRPNFPQLSGYFPARLQLDLAPFGDRALRHFLYLERPEGMEHMHAEGFEPTAPPRDPVEADEIMPRGQEYGTVGRLYRGIANGLRDLVATLGEDGVFIGLPEAQATPERFHWPEMIAVTDLKSGLAAVEQIIEQGEGARGDWHDAHYGRFLAMWEEFHELRREDPTFEPARPVVPAFTRQPFDVDVPQTVITDPLTERTAEVTALSYEVVLHLLLRYFTHTDEDEEQLGALVDAAIQLMVAVLRPLGVALTTLPVGPSHPGSTAGFTFEMFYVMTNAVPARRVAWTLLHERVALLAQSCAQLADEPGAPGAVRAAGAKAHEIAESLRSRI
ncbi:ferritin-like protein [Actinomycetes bacterium KLBMP 9759]